MKLFASNLNFRYSDTNKIPPIAFRYLHSDTHPINPKIRHLYACRDRNTLWWRVSVYPLLPFKRVVRSWSARRARIAFQQALKRHGFNQVGGRIAVGGRDLVGSLEIVVQPQSVQQSFETIQKDTEHLLGQLLKKLAESENTQKQGRQ